MTAETKANDYPSLPNLGQPQTKAGKRPREYLTISATVLNEFMKVYNKNSHEMALALGVSDSTVSKYRTKNQMPALVAHAIEGLKRRMGDRRSRDGVYVMVVPRDKDQTIKEVLNALGVTVTGLRLPE